MVAIWVEKVEPQRVKFQLSNFAPVPWEGVCASQAGFILNKSTTDISKIDFLVYCGYPQQFAFACDGGGVSSPPCAGQSTLCREVKSSRGGGGGRRVGTQWATTGAPEAFCGATSARRGSGTQGSNPGAPAAQRRCSSASRGSSTQWATAGAPEAPGSKEWWARQGKEPPTKPGWAKPRQRRRHSAAYSTRDTMQARTPPASTMKRMLPATNKERALRTRNPWSGGAYVVDGRDDAWSRRAPGLHAHGNTARQVVDGLRMEVCGQQNSQTTPTTTSTTPICQLLGAANAQTAHPATSSGAPAHQPLGSANAETTSAGALAAEADRKQQPDATGEGKNG